MRLELTSLDNPESVKSRVRAALRQLKSERSSVKGLLEQEIGSLRSRLDSGTRHMQPGQVNMVGSLGPQLDASKYNALYGRLYELEETIELLEEVIKPRSTDA